MPSKLIRGYKCEFGRRNPPPVRLRNSAQYTPTPQSIADFLFSPTTNKAAKRFHVKLSCGFFHLLHDFRAALESRGGVPSLVPERCRKHKQSERKDPTMAMFRKEASPRSERRGNPWVQFRWNALSKRSLRQGFSGRFGDSSSRRSRSVPRHLVRASSGAGRTQRKHFAVGESRQALSAAGVPAGSGEPMRNTTQHRETEYFSLFFTLLHLRDIFD